MGNTFGPRQQYKLEPKTSKKTISLEQAIERLEWLGFVITSTDKGIIKGLKNIRNAFEHYEANFHENEIISSYINTLNYFIVFANIYLNRSHLDLFDNMLWQKLINSNKVIRTKFSATIKQIYHDIFETEYQLEGINTCSNCNNRKFVELENKYYITYKCIVCGKEYSLEECYACKRLFDLNELHPNEGDTLLCDDCYQRIDSEYHK